MTQEIAQQNEFNHGLEDDLETILETDQESNYMTTARTNAQKSGGGSQVIGVTMPTKIQAMP